MEEIIQKGTIVKRRTLKKPIEIDPNRDMSKYKLPLFHRMSLSPRSDSELETIAHDLIVWAQEDDAVVFDEFVAISGIHTQRLYEWSKKNETLAYAMATAKRIIGARRERRGLEGKYNGGIVMGMMWNYNDEYRAWKKEMKEKSPDIGSGDVTVVLESFPNSPLVEEKK